MTDKVQKIREEVQRLRIKNTEAFDCGCDGTKCAGYDMACDDILFLIDSLPEKPVSEDLEEASLLYYPKMSRISEPHGIIPADNESHYIGDANEDNRKAFKAGAKWQKERFVAWLTRESDFLIQELKNGNKAYGLPEQYRVQLYKKIIAKIKGE